MDYEIWASDSGNMLLSTPDCATALTWALEYWLREGDEALDALSVGDEHDQWVVRGELLRQELREWLWLPPQPLRTTSATSVLTRGRLALSI